MTGGGDVTHDGLIGWVVRALSRMLPWLVGGFYALALVEVAPSGAAVAAAVVVGVVLGVSLAWRHRHPERAAAVVLGASVPAHLMDPALVLPFAGMVAVWSLARARPPRVSLVGLAGLLGLSMIALLEMPVGDTVFAMVVSVSVWALAEADRNRRNAITEASRRAVSDEQARISRELHDVIAHSVSVIVVQAGAAGDVFESRPDQAREALRSVETTGREALGELRRLLAGVRTDDGAVRGVAGADVPTLPQPGLDRVEELAEPLRAAGLAVAVAREGVPSPLPAGVDISGYRIVQEALTTALRHAHASLVEVTVRYRPDAVEVTVVDDGHGDDGRGGSGRSSAPGLGLVGMRERAASLGGTLEVGPTAHGGYRVHARLPLAVGG